MLTNIFVFVFGPEVDPKYIRIHVKKNISNIFVFGLQKNIHYALENLRLPYIGMNVQAPSCISL